MQGELIYQNSAYTDTLPPVHLTYEFASIFPVKVYDFYSPRPGVYPVEALFLVVHGESVEPLDVRAHDAGALGTVHARPLDAGSRAPLRPKHQAV